MTASVMVGRVGTHPDGEPVDYEPAGRDWFAPQDQAADAIASAKALIRRLAVRCGDIGEDQREYEFEPFGEPAAPEPVVAPVEPVAVPA